MAGVTGTENVSSNPSVGLFEHGGLAGTTLSIGGQLSIDQSGDLWILNQDSTFTLGGGTTVALTEIIGGASPTLAPLAAQNQASTRPLAGTLPGAPTTTPAVRPATPAH